MAVDNSHSNKSPLDQVYDQMEKDGKTPLPPASTSAFLATSLIGVPLWLTTVVPITALYQMGKALLGTSGNKSPPPVGHILTKEDINPDDIVDIVPHEQRQYDLVIFGATGFVGQMAVEYLTKTYGVNKDVKWAVAGRSVSKLEKVTKEVALALGNEDVKSVDVIVADTFKPETLSELVSKTRAVASCAGPFALYGSPLVSNCVKHGTHYVDITGEIDWSRNMIASHSSLAETTGAKIISFCGHDSIPWDVTVHQLTQLLAKQGEELIKVHCSNEYRAAGVSGGTMATALSALGGDQAMNKPRYEYDPFLRSLQGTKSNFRTVFDNPSYPQRAALLPFSGQWAVPSIMAGVNGEVVKRSHALRSKGAKKLTYREELLAPDFKTAFLNYFPLVAFVSAVLNPLTFSLVKRLVPKPGQGPSLPAMKKGYLCVYGHGTGSKGTAVESAFYFPADPGYLDTARMLVESGLCLGLKEVEKDLPITGGGFFTPAVGLGDVLVERLCQTGSIFASRILDAKDVGGNINIQSKL